MPSLVDLLHVLVPALPAAGALALRAVPAAAAPALAQRFAAASLAGAVALAGPVFAAPGAAPWLAIACVVASVLVALLGLRVVGASRRLLAGDPAQPRFLAGILLLLAAVQVLTLAKDLGVMLVAWVATSLALHRLLLFVPGRTGAVFAARKKFVLSRLGDLSFGGAVLVLGLTHGTTSLEAISAAVAAGQTANLGLAGILVAACVLLKTAQFPFHSWLPDTMETPTPVSALMHAGVVNAGGLVLIKLSAVLVHAGAALDVLAVAGAVTAVFGSVVMMAQTSAKRALAFSTVAQMGFMVLQCGLGLFAAALLHLVAHSLYKAHAFLTAGSCVGAPDRPLPRVSAGVAFGGLAFGTVAGGLLFAVAPGEATGLSVLATLVGLAGAQAVAQAAASGGLRLALPAAAAFAGFGSLAIGLHVGAAALLPGLPSRDVPPPVLGLVLGLLLLLLAFTLAAPRLASSPAGRALHVHALNGFSVGVAANRLLGRLKPRQVVAA